MNNVIPLKEILFVFESWTLIIDEQYMAELEVGNEVDLLDEAKIKIGHARLDRAVLSRNPDLIAFAISVRNGPDDLKAVKFIIRA